MIHGKTVSVLVLFTAFALFYVAALVRQFQDPKPQSTVEVFGQLFSILAVCTLVGLMIGSIRDDVNGFHPVFLKA
jgi:hypothetical protein